MKKIRTCFFFAWLLAGSMAVMAQSNSKPGASKDRPSVTGEKNKTVSAEDKKPAGPEDVVELKTDADGRQYQIVDGRKVYTDSQGVQSLATPDPVVKKKEEVQTKSDPKK